MTRRVVHVWEHKSVGLAEVLGHTPTPDENALWMQELPTVATRLKRQLGLRESPFEVVVDDGELAIKASSAVGTVWLTGVELRIVPKFVAKGTEDGGWEQGLASMVLRAPNRHWSTGKTERVGEGITSFQDLLALAFCEAIEEAMHNDPVRQWRVRELESRVLRGRLLAGRQVRSLFSQPGILHCEVDSLDSDNDVNQLLRWAAGRLHGVVRSGATRRRLMVTEHALPHLSGPPRLPHQLPPHLPKQHREWERAVGLATLVARGVGHLPSAGSKAGFGLLLNSADVFEGFLEQSLRETVPAVLGDGWRADGQVQEPFAFSDPEGESKNYYTRPDNVIFRDNEPVLLIDAKYKLLADTTTGRRKRPGNGDLYQLAASLVAHRCQVGMLVSPRVTGGEGLGDGQLRYWRVPGPTGVDSDLLLCAIGLDVSSLGTRAGLRTFDGALMDAVKKVLRRAGILPELVDGESETTTSDAETAA